LNTARDSAVGFLPTGFLAADVSTLVVCLHRGESLGDLTLPVVGEAAVAELVTAVGVDDPEDSRVNAVLETLRVARDLEADGDEAVVAVVAGTGESVSADRQIARQLDQLNADEDLDSAIVVVDSAEDERLVPIVESRVPVDAVDRVVVRQARDIESTYYLLKQFLADEELRTTVLVPLGAALLAFPLLLFVVDSPTVALGAIAATVGGFLLYKGLGIDTYIAALPGAIREALYAGQVSLVTYVVAGGLALVGFFAGALDVSGMSVAESGALIIGARFTYEAVPWLTAAALAASTGRLLDELIRAEEFGGAYVNLPFVAVAVGLAVRGFTAYFLERSGLFDLVTIPPMEFGPIDVEGLTLSSGTHLALYILASILISLIGVRVAAYVSDSDVDVRVNRRRS
jgi:putative membrane protein